MEGNRLLISYQHCRYARRLYLNHEKLKNSQPKTLIINNFITVYPLKQCYCERFFLPRQISNLYINKNFLIISLPLISSYLIKAPNWRRELAFHDSRHDTRGPQQFGGVSLSWLGSLGVFYDDSFARGLVLSVKELSCQNI